MTRPLTEPEAYPLPGDGATGTPAIVGAVVAGNVTYYSNTSNNKVVCFNYNKGEEENRKCDLPFFPYGHHGQWTNGHTSL